MGLLLCQIKKVIMQQIAQKQLDRLNRLLDVSASADDTLLRGRLGMIFYYYHLYKVTEIPALKHRTKAMLEQVFDNINAARPSLVGAALGTGGAGFGYIVNFMCREAFLELEVDNEFEELDKYLFNAASGLIEADNIDLLHGALGVIHYFSEREHTAPGSNDYLDALIEKICRKAVEEDGGYWYRNHLLKIDGKQMINFSLSHGLSGVLLVLLNAYERSSHKALIEKVVKGGIRFMLKHKIDVDFSRHEYSFFPLVIARNANEIYAANRMAWESGDLNEVLLFYRAARLFSDEALKRQADLIGMQSMMRRDEQSTHVDTAGFCTGAAGLAQYCKTLYRETGLDVYQEGYLYWIEKTILLLEEDLEKGRYTGKEQELLDGSLGIAFVLLSYVSNTDLHWSTVLLL